VARGSVRKKVRRPGKNFPLIVVGQGEPGGLRALATILSHLVHHLLLSPRGNQSVYEATMPLSPDSLPIPVDNADLGRKTCTTRASFIAICGRPEAGKNKLMNNCKRGGGVSARPPPLRATCPRLLIFA